MAHCTGQESPVTVNFPEDDEESWSAHADAGDLPPLHNREHLNMLHLCVAYQLHSSC